MLAEFINQLNVKIKNKILGLEAHNLPIYDDKPLKQIYKTRLDMHR